MINKFKILQVQGMILFGSWAPVLNKITDFINGTKTALQGITVGVVTVMAIWYKLREITAEQQEEQMFTAKTRKILIGCVFIFLIPTFITVLESFFK